MRYNNHQQVVAAGLDPAPKHGDIVMWVDNGTTWRVSKRDDLEGPSALRHWPDGGWCNVRLLERKGVRVAHADGGEAPNPKADVVPASGALVHPVVGQTDSRETK